MSRVVDTHGRPVAEGGVWITLRADRTGGISLGGDASIEPGETKQVPAHIALPLLENGQAVRAPAPAAAPEAPVVEEPAPAPPAAARKRKAP